jgi:hypothetical protein
LDLGHLPEDNNLIGSDLGQECQRLFHHGGQRRRATPLSDHRQPRGE